MPHLNTLLELVRIYYHLDSRNPILNLIHGRQIHDFPTLNATLEHPVGTERVPQSIYMELKL